MNKHTPSTPELHRETTPETSTIQERHPDWPELDVLFYFGPHGHADNFKDVPAHIAKADVYLYENVGTTGLKHGFQEISSNPAGPVDNIIDYADIGGRINGTIWEPIIRGIHGTDIAVSSFDLRGSKEFEHMFDNILNPDVMVVDDTFEGSIEILQKNMSAWADLQNQREEIMADRFESEIEYLLKSYPQLKEKSQLKVLITMGSAHTSLRHKMINKGIPSSSEYTTNTPYIHSFNMELLRTYMHNREASQELLEQAWVENVVTGLIRAHQNEEAYDAKNYDALSIHNRDLISKLNHDQREQIYRLTRQSQQIGFNNLTDFYTNVSDILKQYGGQGLASSPEEMNKRIQSIEQLSLEGLAGHTRRFKKSSNTSEYN